MQQKNYMTPEEQKLWEYIQDKEIIETELLHCVFPEWPSTKINKTLHSLSEKWYLQRAKRGLYYNPKNLKSYYELALRIHEGYLGLSSALRFYNLLDYEDFTVFIITKDYRKKMQIKGTAYSFEFLAFGELYCGFEKRENIYISSKEKTLFDCLLKPGIVGYSTIAKALNDVQPMHWNTFVHFFSLTKNIALKQRTGYLLELLQKKTKMRVPSFVFEILEKGIKTPVKLTTDGKTLSFNQRWKVQDTVGEKNIMAWWY